MPDYLKLYTPQDSAAVFIDHQPPMLLVLVAFVAFAVVAPRSFYPPPGTQRLRPV